MFQKCTACSGSLSQTTIPSALNGSATVEVQRCGQCGGIHFEGYRGDGFAVVRFDRFAGDAQAVTYFDLDLLGSEGRHRVHGWMGADRRVVQFG